MRMGLTAVIALGLGACAQPRSKDSTMDLHAQPDAQLIARVRTASAAPVNPVTVEAAVGQAALINTATGYPIGALKRVDIRPDPEHVEEPLTLAIARAVIYWGRPVPSDNPRVVGIQVLADGSGKVFFGVIYPP